MDKKLKITNLIDIIDQNDSHFIQKVTNTKIQEIRQKKTKKSASLSVNERNHARILYQKVEEVIAHAGFQHQPELHSYFYLSELLQRNAFTLFDKDIKKHSKKLKKNEELIAQILLQDLALERKITAGLVTRDTLVSMNKILTHQLELINTFKLNFEFRYKAYQALIHSIDPEILKNTIEISTKPNGLWQKIYTLRTEVNSAPSIDQKVVFLLKLHDLTVKSNSNAVKREHAATCSNLATYLMILGKFDKAILYYEAAIKLRKFFRPANYYTLQYNFVGLCLRNNQFEQAYQYMLKVDETVQKLPAIAFKWQLLRSMCCVLYGKEKEIKNILPTVPDKKDKRDYVYFYAIWAIYFTRENKTETALQMLETARSLSKRHKGEASISEFIHLLKKYHLFTYKYGQKQALIKTVELVKNIDLTQFASGNILPLVWLNKYLKNHL